PWGLKTIEFAGFVIAQRQVAALVTAVVLTSALLVFFKYSRMGLAMRAAAFDQDVALTQGVSVAAVLALFWAWSSGYDLVSGALVGALIIGIAETLTSTYQQQFLPQLGTGFAQVVPYLVMFVVLLVRPTGLFGTEEVERV